MEIKTLEIRDRATFIPVVAMRVSQRSGWMFGAAGYGDIPLVIVMKLNGCEAQYSPYKWDDKRTMRNAHAYLQHYWDEVKDGSLIDVEDLLNETSTPCYSEQTHYKNVVGV